MASAPLLALVTSIGGAFALWAAPFTYQGRLVDGPGLAGGNYELTFRLFDSAEGGAQVGGDLVLSSVGVTNGLFTVELDFGSAAFTGAARWLQLSARTNGAATPAETLLPRQSINAVPYAMRAFAGSGDASELAVGTVPDARLSPNISRLADLNSLSNALTARLVALEAALNSLSNRVPAGVTVASASAVDASLLGDGWSKFSSVPAPVWNSGATAGAPSARSGHSAVWNGTGWMVWGGAGAGGAANASGAVFDPVADAWNLIPVFGAPEARQGHSAAWTGESMLIWGGFGATDYLSSGGRYSPSSTSWSDLVQTGVPAGRSQHVTVWTGTRLLVWGGRNFSGLLSDGSLCDPASGWSDLPTAGAPESRSGAAGVWTGTEFIVWGGTGAAGELGTGARLPLAGGSSPGAWTELASAGAPSARTGHSLVWTGSKVMVWGGSQGGVPVNTGAAYDPVTDQWADLPTTGAPDARSGHVAVWTGEEMVIFGGQGGSGSDSALATGAAYHPGSGVWRPLTTGGAPVARTRATGLWAGDELIIFGGVAGAGPVAALQRLHPQPTWYLYRKP